MATVSILLLTLSDPKTQKLDRFHPCREYVGEALRNAGHPFDLCITDQGSTNPEQMVWNEVQNPKVYNRNTENAGTAQALNRMIEQNKTDHYVFIGNDIQLPEHWLRKFMDYASKIPESGVIGINWRGAEKIKPGDLNGHRVSYPIGRDAVFGTMFIPGTVRERIGKFCEDYGPYGLWDGDYSIRAAKAGFINYYLPGVTSHHFGSDVGEESEYRKMKDASISKAAPVFEANKQKYAAGEVYI